MRLLTRGRGMRPTPAGECLAEHAQRVLAEMSALESDMARHAGPCGRLVVGASSTPGELLMPKLAVDFSAGYPDVTLDVRVDDTEKIVAALLRREIEVAVAGREVHDPRLEGAVIGASGVGKSTLFRALTRSVPLHRGRVIIGGHGFLSP